MKARPSRLLVLAVALPAAQAGHLLAYQLRFGAAAQQVQSTGAHAYFPMLAKTGLGLAGAAMLAALFVLGLARVVIPRRSLGGAVSPSYLPLLAALFTMQLALFASQETAEAALAGAPASSIPMLLLWGTLSQLPIAAVAALGLRWLLTRFGEALTDLKAALSAAREMPGLVAALAPGAVAADPILAVSRLLDSSPHKRGPPQPLRVSSL